MDQMKRSQVIFVGFFEAIIAFTNLKTYFPQRHVMHQNFVATAEFKGIKNAKEDVSEKVGSMMVTKIAVMALMKKATTKQ